jgi:hypothetical protein
MNYSKVIGYIVIAVILTGCQEVFRPEVDRVDPFIIVEAFVTTNPGRHTVLISTSAPFADNNAYQRVNDAIVYITDDRGQRHYFWNISSGIYQSDSSDMFSAEVGRTYILNIILSDGTYFQSTPQTVVQSPAITSLFCNYDQETILTENGNGEILEIPSDGIRIIGETKGIQPANNYYFYKWRAYEEHVSHFRIEAFDLFLYQHRPLSARYSSLLTLGNADEFGNYDIRNNKMLFIASYDMYYYTPPVHDTMMQYLVSSGFQGLLFKLEQHSLTPDAYDFWNDAKEQLEAGGRIFDPVTPQLHGNIACVSDSLTKVIGIFTVTDVTEKYAYLYINSSNKVFSKDIDSYPELFLDSLHVGMPVDWIRPPF